MQPLIHPFFDAARVGEEICRRRAAAEKSALAREVYEPGMSVSLVARKHGISASQLLYWRKLQRDGDLLAVHTSESVVSNSKLAAERYAVAFCRIEFLFQSP